MSFFDTELFIVEVEKEECLWKMNSKDIWWTAMLKQKPGPKLLQPCMMNGKVIIKKSKNLRVSLKFSYIIFKFFYIHITYIRYYTYPCNDIIIC